MDFSRISGIPQLIKDYLEEGSALSEGIGFSKANFQRQILEKSNSFSYQQRETLHGVLQSQCSGLELSELQKNHLEALLSENTFTVVTGHQLNLFTGPAFFIYKIMQMVKTAIWLKQQFPEKYFVPVFWMATEDHDFEEINHFKTEAEIYRMNAGSGGAVGRIIIEDTDLISEFEKEFADTVYGTELILWMKEAYVIGRTLADATRRLVNRIFSEYGLLILDGDDARLKKQMIPTFTEELLDRKLQETTQSAVEKLKNEYGKVQVNPREINLFYLDEKRERIDPDGEGFILNESSRKFSKESILDELQQHPEKFSPNALMRPVFQETVLPNVAYIGGNAEVMYWLELKDYFKHLKLPFPVLVPRNSFLYIKEKTVRKIEKSGLQTEDFFENYKSLINAYILKDSELLNEIELNETQLKTSFNTLKSKASLTDISFRNLVEAEETRQLKSFEKMRRRLLRAEKIKQSEKVAHLESLYTEVHPRNIWQERVFNFSVFYADKGPEWLQNCFENTVVEKSALIISEI